MAWGKKGEGKPLLIKIDLRDISITSIGDFDWILIQTNYKIHF